MTDEQNTTFIPEPKKPGDLIRSNDWNAAMDEIARLGQAMLNRVNRAGDTINGPLQVTDAFNVEGDLTAGAALSVAGPLTVEDAATINGDLTLRGALKPEGALTVADLTVTNTLNLEGTLTVADLTVNNALNLNGAFNLTGPLTVAELTVTDTFNLEGALTVTGLTVSGNVGIGTTDPQSTLDVQGDIRINKATFWLWGGTSKHHGIGYYGLKEREENTFADTDIDGPVVFGYNGGALGSTGGGEKLALAWDKAGNVGIGTTEPQANLHVQSDAPMVRIEAPVGDGKAAIQLREHRDSGFDIRYDGAADQLQFTGMKDSEPEGAPLVIQRGNGNVGIGTTEPQANLHIEDEAPVLHISSASNKTSTIQLREREVEGRGFDIWYSGANPVALIIEGVDRGKRVGKQIVIDRGSGKFTAPEKSFRIRHPTRAGYDLVHACIEGPENGVYYRGIAHLQDGRATVQLPAYFAALTRPEDHTVQLTALGPEPFLLSYTPIVDGQFTVYGSHPEGAFAWHVTAVRADVPALEVEVEKED